METELRIALLVAGLVLLATLFFLGRFRGRRASRKRKVENFDFEKEPMNSLDREPDLSVDILTSEEEGAADGLDNSIEMLPEEELGPGYQPSLLGQESEKQAEVVKLVVVHVMAKRPRLFNGADIIGLVREFGLEYDDDMSVFHKTAKRLGNKKAVYSILNVVKPGTFDLGSMSTFDTPGISFVMSLPGPEKGLKSFNMMIEAAKRTAERLRGDLLDESRNRLNPQAIARMQEDVQLFILKHSSHSQ